MPDRRKRRRRRRAPGGPAHRHTGRSVGTLTAQAPTVWDGGRYRSWDGKITPGESINISYALSQPDWSHVASRANRTYVMRAVLSVGGADETLEHGAILSIESPETSLPPNVRT